MAQAKKKEQRESVVSYHLKEQSTTLSSKSRRNTGHSHPSILPAFSATGPRNFNPAPKALPAFLWAAVNASCALFCAASVCELKKLRPAGGWRRAKRRVELNGRIVTVEFWECDEKERNSLRFPDSSEHRYYIKFLTSRSRDLILSRSYIVVKTKKKIDDK